MSSEVNITDLTDDLLNSLIETVKADLKKISAKSKTEQLDSVSSRNLTNYAKIILDIDKHHRRIEEKEMNEELSEEDLELLEQFQNLKTEK